MSTVWTKEKILEIARALHLSATPKKDKGLRCVDVAIPFDTHKNNAWIGLVEMLKADKVSFAGGIGGTYLYVYYAKKDKTKQPVDSKPPTPFDLSNILHDAKNSGLTVDVLGFFQEGISIAVTKTWSNVDQVLPFAKLEKELQYLNVPFKLVNDTDPAKCRLLLDCSPCVLIKHE